MLTRKSLYIVGVFGLIASVLASLCLGKINYSPLELISLINSNVQSVERDILLNIRLPRVILGVVAGSTLAMGGVYFQTILRNQLAEPYILGVSGGASVGVLLGMFLQFGFFSQSLFAFLGSLLALIILFLLKNKDGSAASLLLSGVMINIFCGALIMLLIFFLRSSSISSIMFWFMGSLANVTLKTAITYALFILPCCVLLSSFGHILNILYLGEEEATSLGISASIIIVCFIVVISLLVALIVAVAGPLGFVGLVVPQVAGLVWGWDRRVLAPACLFLGSIFLVVCDFVARVILGEGEIPVGVVTALCGVPIFIILQKKQKL